MTITAAAFEPLVVRRLRRPGTDIAHLFPERAGWSRCLCRAIPWSAALVPAELGAKWCADCDSVAAEIGTEVRDPRIPEMDR